MGTLTAAFHIATEALQADQEALNVTANNVANQNTPGYAREVASFQAVDLVTINGQGQLGDGVTALPPTSVRDRVLEQRIEQQTQVQSQSSTVQTALNQVQQVFSLSSSSTSSSLTTIGTAVNSFFTSLSTLVNNPSQSATRQGVLSAASSLANIFNSSQTQLTQIKGDLNGQSVAAVGQVNQLLTTIAGLNAQIAAASPNADAGVLEDQRQSAISQLSQYVGLQQIRTAQNGIELTTSNNGLLVAGTDAYPLSASIVAGTVQVLAGPTNVNVTAGLTGGSLGGNLQVLTNELPTIQNSLDTLAYSVATAVNTQNEAGLDANGNPGTAIFNVPASAAGTAVSISVAITDPNLVAAAGPGEGSSGSTNATALANLGSATIVAGQTATGYLSGALALVGTAASAANTDLTVQQATLNQLTTQRNALSGVSLDEEAANLTQYQRSYQAASSLFAIINTLYASEINLGYEATVS